MYSKTIKKDKESKLTKVTHKDLIFESHQLNIDINQLANELTSDANPEENIEKLYNNLEILTGVHNTITKLCYELTDDKTMTNQIIMTNNTNGSMIESIDTYIHKLIKDSHSNKEVVKTDNKQEKIILRNNTVILKK